MKNYSFQSLKQIPNYIEQAPKSYNEIWDNMKTVATASIIKIDDSVWAEILFNSKSFPPYNEPYRTKFYEPLIKPASQAYKEKYDIYNSSKTDFDWGIKINQGEDYASNCFGSKLEKKISTFLKHNNKLAGNNLSAQASKEIDKGSKDKTANESYNIHYDVLRRIKTPKNQLNESILGSGVLGAIFGTLVGYHQGDNQGVNVGDVSDEKSAGLPNGSVNNSEVKESSHLSVHRQIQEYVTNILNAYRNCVESIVGKAASDKLLNLENIVQEANTLCEKYFSSFLANKNELLKDAFSSSIAKQKSNLQDQTDLYAQIMKTLFDSKNQNLKSVSPNDLDTIQKQMKAIEKKKTKMWDYNSDGYGGSISDAESSFKESNEQVLNIPTENFQKCYDNILQIIDHKVVESVSSVPVEDWKLVVDASTYMHKEAENVDKEIKNKINIICNVNDTNQKANFGAFGGKLRSAIPYKAEGLRTLWGQKYITMLSNLNRRLERDVINGAPVQYLMHVLKVTFPRLVSIMLTYKYIYEKIEKPVENIQIGDVNAKEELDEFSKVQNELNDNLQRNIRNIVNYISGVGNKTINTIFGSSNVLTSDLWFIIFSKYGGLLKSYTATIKVPATPNSSNGKTSEVKVTLNYMPKDQLDFWKVFIQSISKGAKTNRILDSNVFNIIAEIFMNMYYDQLNFNTNEGEPLMKQFKTITIQESSKDLDYYKNINNRQWCGDFQIEISIILNLLKQAVLEAENFMNRNIIITSIYKQIHTNANLRKALLNSKLNENLNIFLDKRLFEDGHQNLVSEFQNHDVADFAANVQANTSSAVNNPQQSDSNIDNTTEDNEETTEAATEAATEETTTQEDNTEQEKYYNANNEFVKNLREAYDSDPENDVIGFYLLKTIMQLKNNSSKEGKYSNILLALDNQENVDEQAAMKELKEFIGDLTGERKVETPAVQPTQQPQPSQNAQNTQVNQSNSGNSTSVQESEEFYFQNNKIIII